MAPKRERIPLGTIVARLEHVLDLKNKELLKEMATNRAAKASTQLLECLRLAALALQDLMAREAPDKQAFLAMEDPPILSELDAAARGLMEIMQSSNLSPAVTNTTGSSGKSGGSGGGGVDGDDGGDHETGNGSREGMERQKRLLTAAGSGAVSVEAATAAASAAMKQNQVDEAFSGSAAGMPTSEFLKRIVAVRYDELDRAGFISWWCKIVRELALIMEQSNAGAEDGPQQLQEAISKASIGNAGHFLSKPWAPTLLPLNLETGESGEAPPSRWKRVARSFAATPDQAMLYAFMNKWWKATAATLNDERQWLVARAAEAPQDAVVADEAAAGLERVNIAYRYSAVSTLVVMLSTFQTPMQAAQINVQSFPNVPLLTAILDALEQMRESATTKDGTPAAH